MNVNNLKKLGNSVTESVREQLNMSHRDISDCEAQTIIEGHVLSDEKLSCCNYLEKGWLVQRAFCSIRTDLDILQPFADDQDVSEIMVNGKDHIFIEKQGRVYQISQSFDSTEALEEVIRRIAGKVHREINELKPIVDARLADGSRVNAVYKNIAVNGPILTIRKFPEKALTMDMMIRSGTITQEAAGFLEKLVVAGYNCFISGGTSSGKTTFLSILSNYIPPDERVIVIEDSAELQIRGIKNIVRLECKNANVQGKGEIDMCQLIKTSLRMRPDRIIVGEVRGREVMDMINGLNTGHDGSMSTGHGNSIEGMLRRLESMYLQAADFPVDAIRGQIAEAIDIIIHLGRLSDKSRKVLEIAEIQDFKEDKFIINSIFKYKIGAGLIATGSQLANRSKLDMRGIVL